MALMLQRRHVPYRIVEARDQVGDTWRSRYASLTLFTPRSHSALPDMPLQGDPNGYPSREEFAAYLEAYATAQGIRVETGKRVERLTRKGQKSFLAVLSDGEEIAAKAVIVAAGGFQNAVVPALSERFGSSVHQLTSETYHSPSDVPSGQVLVVGDGASGRDIATELSAKHDVILAAGKTRNLLPEEIFGKSIWWWMDRMGLLRASQTSLVGKIMRRRDPFPDRDRNRAALERRGVRVASRLVDAESSTAVFADGGRADVGCVIWCVGYRDETKWTAIPGAVSHDGSFLHEKGASPASGLFFIGRPWQRNRASALVMGAGADAEALCTLIVAHLHPAT